MLKQLLQKLRSDKAESWIQRHLFQVYAFLCASIIPYKIYQNNNPFLSPLAGPPSGPHTCQAQLEAAATGPVARAAESAPSN